MAAHASSPRRTARRPLRSIPLAHQIQRIHERTLTSRVFPGDIIHGQPFVHLDDVIAALWLTVERRRELPRELVLLIGEDETLSYDELQRTLGSLIHGEAWETTEIPKAVAKTGAWVQDHIPGEEPLDGGGGPRQPIRQSRARGVASACAVVIGRLQPRCALE